MYIGVDGCPAGWVAIVYDEDGYHDSGIYQDISDLWNDYRERVETVLIDVPIGLREHSSTQRPPDRAAREKLGHPRSSSVFPVPVRAAVHAEDYQTAKAKQESHTDGSLGVQAWNIAENIAQLDTFLRDRHPEAVGTVREAHPEVCFWALNAQETTTYSKTGQPAAAVWERIEILEAVDPAAIEVVRDVGTDLAVEVGLDDILDALVLAMTASPLTGDLQTLPAQWPPEDSGDPTGIPMEMVYAEPAD